MRMPMFFSATTLVSVTLLVAAYPLAGAEAAPQVLALLATDGATTLKCEDGRCAAEFSAYCLQRERPDPDDGIAYQATDDGMTLIVTAADGTRRQIPATDYVSIVTQRSYTAVRVSVPEGLLQEWNATEIALEVGQRVSLIPLPTADDPEPQTEADIALAVGPQRAVGARLVDRSAEASDAVRLTNAMINALPERGRVAPGRRGNLWAEVIEPRAGGHSRESIEYAGRIYDGCQRKVEHGLVFSLRRCLEAGHDALMIGLNVRYWNAGPGS